MMIINLQERKRHADSKYVFTIYLKNPIFWDIWEKIKMGYFVKTLYLIVILHICTDDLNHTDNINISVYHYRS